jgi:phage shock protein PspC (stress-responsive transcriptional regulator)
VKQTDGGIEQKESCVCGGLAYKNLSNFMINGTCIAIVIFAFLPVVAYIFAVHYFIKDSEKDSPNHDSGHGHSHH